METLYGLPRSAAAQRRRRLAAAAAVGLATYVLWRASRKGSTARQYARVITDALQQRTGKVIERGSECVVAGALKAVYRVASAFSVPPSAAAPASQTFPVVALEMILEKVFSERGQSAISLAVAVAVERGVSAVGAQMQQQRERQEQQQRPPAAGQEPGADGESPAHSEPVVDETAAVGNPIVAQLLRWAATPEGERFALAAIRASTGSGTEAYMASIAGTNMFDDLFSAMFKPQHRESVRELTAVVTRAAVSTYLAPNAEMDPSMRGFETRGPEYTVGAAEVSSEGWIRAIGRAKEGAGTVIKQSWKHGGSVPVVAYASARGAALGVHDVLAQPCVSGDSATWWIAYALVSLLFLMIFLMLLLKYYGLM